MPMLPGHGKTRLRPWAARGSQALATSVRRAKATTSKSKTVGRMEHPRLVAARCHRGSRWMETIFREMVPWPPPGLLPRIRSDEALGQ
ncbi:hypothetical protein RJ55_06883 [Drechmeria coniospora]|nr:hypothetical protein RJ55_06883 [Drechmeria coniospora]